MCKRHAAEVRAIDTRRALRAVPGRVRDRACAVLLGIPAERVPALRAMVAEGGVSGKSPAKAPVKARAFARAKVASELSMPDIGANVDAAEFRAAVESLKPCVTSRSRSIPILGHVLVTPTADGLTLQATDLEAGGIIHVRGMVRDLQPFTAPITLLAKSLKGCSGEVNFCPIPETSDTRMTCSDRESVLPGFPAEEFPDFPDVTGDYHEVKGLLPALRRVWLACSQDESRAVMTGVNITPCEVIATDGHRLHVANIASGLNDAIIVPASTLQKLSRVLGVGDDDSIEIRASETQVQFRFGTRTLTSRLIEGMFPNHTKVIPQEHTRSIDVDPAAMLAAIDAVKTVAVEGSCGRAVFTVTGNELLIQAKSGPCGKAESRVTLMGRAGDLSEYQFALDVRYLADVMTSFKGAALVRFEMTDWNQPIKFMVPGDDSGMVVLMPMQPE